MINIVIFSGTAREDSKTRKIADFIEKIISKKFEYRASIIDPREMEISLNDEAYGDEFPKLRKMVNRADAYIIVAPEYNHGYSAGLKFILDLNLKEYFHKPVALVGVSKGPFGGTRVIENLLPVVRRLGMIVSSVDFSVSRVEYIFAENGEIVDPDKLKKRATPMIDELVWMTEALKVARES